MAHDGGAAFAAYLAQKRPQIEDYLARFTLRPEDCTVHAATDLMRYLYEPVTRFTSGGGKRTRPALCLLGAQAIGVDPICALSTAAAIEYFQSAALIHDDIADKSELRRGMPCLHVSEGTGIAVNAGDLALVSVASELLTDSSLENETCLRLLCELTYMEQRTLEGQALDLGWVRDERWDVTVDDYLYMASHKTAYYSAATPLACGAICAGGTDEQIEALFSFGLDAGLAFQLQDDLLNLVGDAAQQGKDYRSDITEGKRTLMAVWALEHLPEQERAELQQLLSSGTTDEGDLTRAVELIEQAGAVAYARQYAHELVDRAQTHLDGVDIDSGAREVLESMADFFVERLG